MNSICVSLFLLMFPIYIVVMYFILTPSFFEPTIVKENLMGKFRLSKETIIEIEERLFTYIKSESSEYNKTYDQNSSQELFFNKREEQHIDDIKNMISRLDRLSKVLAGLAFISFGILFYKKQNQYIFKTYFLLFSFIITFILVCLLLYLMNKTWFINTMHAVFFNNQLWVLNPVTDRLIWFFPKYIILKMIIYLGISEATTFLFIGFLKQSSS